MREGNHLGTCSACDNSCFLKKDLKKHVEGVHEKKSHTNAPFEILVPITLNQFMREGHHQGMRKRHLKKHSG
jgi:hypothetical protein